MTNSSTPNPPPKLDPENLVLKAAPRRVVRFKRHLLIGAAVVACLGLVGVTWLALGGSHRPTVAVSNGELYNTDRKPTADALANLPGNYGQLHPDTPRLGPPLPGDLGPPILRHQQQLAATGPNAAEQAAEAERQRLAQQARTAAEASVFFQVSRPTSGVAAPQPTSSASPAPTATGDKRLNLNLDRDQNDQQRKLDFVTQPTARDIYNTHALQTPASPYEIMAGSVIAASLITGINSDLPGTVIAQVTENVYDTVTGRTLLIPQGSRLIGAYDSVVAFGQSRALLVWQRIVMPDGSSIQIDNLPATDMAGYAGLEDEVDYHTWTLLKGVAMSTLLGVGTQVSFGSDQSNLVEAIRQSTQESTNQAGQRIIEKDLNIQPTITVRPGWPLRVIIHKDLVLRPWRG